MKVQGFILSPKETEVSNTQISTKAKYGNLPKLNTSNKLLGNGEGGS